MSSKESNPSAMRGTPDSVNDLPSPHYKERGGFVYVVEFSDGTVKPGRTDNPRRRMREHVAMSSKFGIALDRYWVSPVHDDWWENETAILNAVRGTCNMNGEYLTGISFDDVVGIAESLTYQLMSDDEWETFISDRTSDRLSFQSILTAMGAPDPELAVHVLDRDIVPVMRGLLSGPEGWSQLDVGQGLDVTPDRIATVERFAAQFGVPIEVAMRMDHIDVMEAAIVAHVRAAAVNARTWAITSSRTDLTKPVLNVSTLDT